VGYTELKGNGAFLVPGFAKFVVIKRPAAKARNHASPAVPQSTPAGLGPLPVKAASAGLGLIGRTRFDG
jgi:hypothetical protein